MSCNTNCSICLKRNNKSSEVLSCYHKFHTKCLSIYEHINIINSEQVNYIHSCPYCRTKYNHISENTRNNLEKRKTKIINYLIKKLTDIVLYNDSDKIDTIIKIYSTLIDNINITKYFNDSFRDMIKYKTNEIKNLIDNFKLDTHIDLHP